MRLATFIIEGRESYGLVLCHPATGEDWVFEPGKTEARIKTYAASPTSPLNVSCPFFLGDAWPASLADFLALEEKGMNAMRQLRDFLVRFLEQADQFILLGGGYPLNQVKLRPPIPRPRLLLGLTQNSPTFWRNDPNRPHVNLYPQAHQRPLGSILDPGDPVVMPDGGAAVGAWNPELGIIIGKRGREIPVTSAMSYVAGLTVVSDVSLNYFTPIVFAEPGPHEWFEACMGSWGDKKSDARFPMGPFLVTMDEVGNPYDLLIYTRQSGFLRDRSHTGAMCVGIERTVSWVSSFRELQPGDVIHMATMGYDGLAIVQGKPPGPQDNIEGEIEKVGLLRSPVVIQGATDWRPANDPARTHPSPVVREFVAAGLDVIAHQADWSLAQTRHFWTVTGNYQAAEKIENLRQRPYPRFHNAPSSALTSTGSCVRLPKRTRTLSLSCELACVVARMATRISVQDAANYILGYSTLAVLRDSSFLDIIAEPSSEQERSLPRIYARWPDGFNIIGKSLVTKKPKELTKHVTMIDLPGFGKVTGNTDEYLLSGAEILSFISRFITLFPGDVIALGRMAEVLTVAADTRIPTGTAGYAEIESIGRVDFSLNDCRISSGASAP